MDTFHRPHIEFLEPRQLFSGAEVHAGTLFVRGTPSDDVIVLRVDLHTGIVIFNGDKVRIEETFGRINVKASNGNDRVKVSGDIIFTSVHISGGLGNDRLHLQAQLFAMFFTSKPPSPGPANISGGLGDDVIVNEAGESDVWGAAAGKLFGGPGNDRITSGEKDDLLMGGRGNDTLNGGVGNDSIFGGNGNDELDGGVDISSSSYRYPDHDLIAGEAGDDTLISSAGPGDTMLGGEGNDLIHIDSHQDLVDGGPGEDRFD